MQKHEGLSRSGIFLFSSDDSVMGHLTLKGENSTLQLYTIESFEVLPGERRCIHGILHDEGEKISLLDCILLGSKHQTRQDKSHITTTLFPHFAILGNEHINNTDEIITSLHAILEDAPSLFYDFEAFGIVLKPDLFIKEIIRFKRPDSNVEIGSHPIIQYYTGKKEIFQAQTILGKISASHNPCFHLPSSQGLYLPNTITIDFDFEQCVSFPDALSRFWKTLLFFEIIVGRPQVISSLSLTMRLADEHPVNLDVYMCMPPKRHQNSDSTRPHSSDILIDPVTRPEYFAKVLTLWLEKTNEREDSRSRFSQSFRQENRYSIDRLIGAANMFDILPDSVLGTTFPVSDELTNTCNNFRAKLKKIPSSPERDGLLSTIGRIGKHSLRTKIKYRAKPILDILSDNFPEMELVIDETVNCRNYYVHGTKQRNINYEKGGLLSFFTNTLEFIFVASDLMDAGWDIKEWSSHGSTLSHPMAQYFYDYKSAYGRLKEILSKNLDCPISL